MTASQWFDLAVIAVAFIAAVSGWRSGALGSLMSFVGVVLGAVAGRAAGAAHRQPHQRRPHQAVRRAVPDPRHWWWSARSRAWCWAGRCAARSATAAMRAVDSVIGVVLHGGRGAGRGVVVGDAAARRRISRALARAFGGRWCSPQVDQVAPSWLRTVPKRLSALLNTSGLSDVWQPFGHTPIAPVDAPDAAPGRAARWWPDAAERGEDSRLGQRLPEGARRHRLRGLTGPGDVQRSRGRGSRQRHGGIRRHDL